MADERDLWERYCRYFLADHSLGFSLDISRVQFEDGFLAAMAPAMSKAMEAMADLEQGAISNIDEKRMVGHYWLRDAGRAPTAEIESAIRENLASIREFAAQVREGTIHGDGGRFQHLLHVGIGGSALGPQFVTESLGGADDHMTLHFIDNTDPDGIDRTLASLNPVLGQTLVAVVSKSGGTPEPRNGMLEVKAAYEREGLNFARHAIAITLKGSVLDRQAGGWIRRFPMWDWVGGRTSVMSAVGLVPAALQGIDIDAFLDGAAAMDRLTRVGDLRRNPSALLALMWHKLSGGHGEKDMVILPYKDRLMLFSRYLQQLVMESLGKELDRDRAKVCQGLTVYGNKGSTDQHAYLQQLRDGVANFFVTFIQILADRKGSSIEVDPGATAGDYLFGFFRGTRRALYDNGRDSITLTFDALTPATVGALIALYERAVGLYAELINVNAYHQPGVEAGKKAAADVFDLQRAALGHLEDAENAHTAAEIAVAIGQSGEVEEVFKILEHLAANPGRGVTMQPGDSPRVATFRAG